jgi:hypothetical protein
VRRAQPAVEWLDPEGYFIARVRGEDAVRSAPHPLAEADEPEDEASSPAARPLPAADEALGELPPGYGEDALLGMARDPRTLFLYWDHARETLKRAFEGLEEPRAQLWLFERQGSHDWQRCRVLDLVLESRSHYVHELAPGRVYRAEIHLVGRSGEARLLGTPSNDVHLPPLGPSALVDDSFARIPWDRPLGEVRKVSAGGAFPDELRSELARLSDWARFPGETRGSAAGGMGGRPSAPAGGGAGEEGP